MKAWQKHRIIAIVGNLRGGKTLTLSYLAFNEWLKGQQIYSNYFLDFSKDQERVTFLDVKKKNRKNEEQERLNAEYEKLGQGFLAFDEIWQYADARKTSTRENELVSKILLRAGHEGFNVAYTTQRMRQVDVRLREITNFIFFPKMMLNNRICLVNVLKVNDDGTTSKLPHFRFKPHDIYPLYNTRERVGEFTPNSN